MITSELLDYIRSSLAAGTDQESIKNELRSTGWIDSDIEAAFASVASPHVSTTSRSWHIGRREVVMSVAALLLLAGIASAGYYYYVPANPEKIVKAAWENLEGVTSFDYSGRFDVEVSNAAQTLSLDKFLGGKVAGAESEKLIVDFTGSADLTNTELPKTRTLLTMTYSPFILEVETILIDKDYFFRVGDLPALGDLEISKYFNQWIKVDKEYLDQYTETENEMEEELDRRAQDMFDNSHIFNGLERTTDEIVDGQKMHHFIYKVDQQGWRDFLEKIAQLGSISVEEYQEIEDFTFTDGEIWIGKSDKMIHKITGAIIIKATEDDPGGRMDWEFGIRNFNQPAAVTAPTQFKDLEEIIAEYKESMAFPSFPSVEN